MNIENNIDIGIEKLIQTENVDFLDFGCSDGASLLFGQKILGGKKGLGIDTSSKKVKNAGEKNLLAVLYDIKKLPNKKKQRQVSLKIITTTYLNIRGFSPLLHYEFGFVFYECKHISNLDDTFLKRETKT